MSNRRQSTNVSTKEAGNAGVSSYRLDLIASVQQGYTFSPDYQGKPRGKWPYVKVGDLNAHGNTKYLRRTTNYINDDVLAEMRATPFLAGSIVFPRVGAALRNNNKRILQQDSLTDDNVIVVTVRNPNICCAEYLYYWFDYHDLQQFCNDGTVPVINGKNLKQQKVPLPGIETQEGIAAILSTWDASIENTVRLIAAKEKFLAGISQELFGGGMRQSKPGWKTLHLSEVLIEHGHLSTGKEEVYSVSVHKGLVNQIEHLGRSFSAIDTSNYNVVQPGDIVYTKSPTGDFPYGIVKQSYADANVIVSPLYGVFSPLTPDLGVVIDLYFESPTNAGNYLRSLIQKGAKNTIGITNSGFLSGILFLPLDPKEQKNISKLVLEARKEVSILEVMKLQYEEQKRGLMQKLLTGQWQVKAAETGAN